MRASAAVNSIMDLDWRSGIWHERTHDLLEASARIVFRSRRAGAREELRFHVDMGYGIRRRSGLDEGRGSSPQPDGLGRISAPARDARDARGTRLLQDSNGDFMYPCARWHGAGAHNVASSRRDRHAAPRPCSAVDAVSSPLPYSQPGELVRLYMSYGKEPTCAGS